MFDLDKLAQPVEIVVCDDGTLNPGETLVQDAPETEATHRLVDGEFFDLVMNTITEAVEGHLAVGGFWSKAHQLFHRDDEGYGDRDQPTPDSA
jgi:hypothetical protein